MNKEKAVAFLKHFLILTLIIYAVDWFMSVGYKLLKGADFTTLNNQYHFKWTWIGVAIGISYLRVKSKAK